MPQIIELLGPSGIGKSSIYNELRRRWQLEHTWGVYHDIRYKRKPRRKFPDDYLTYIKRKKEESNQVFHYEDHTPNNLPNERVFFEKHPVFANRAIDLIGRHSKETFGGEDHRFLNCHFFFETAEQFQAIKNRKNDSRVCLMDEGFLSRLMHLTSPSFSIEDLYFYLEYMPLPNGVIYLECEPEEVLSRILERRRTATLHKGMATNQILDATKKTQEWMVKSIDYFRNKGIQVYTVSAESSVSYISNQIMMMLDNEFNVQEK